MFEEFIYNGINWAGNGYFGCPNPPKEFVLPKKMQIMNKPLDVWAYIFKNAKEGDFSKSSMLIDILIASAPSPLAMSCSELIGDIGTKQCFDRILKELKKTDKYELANQFCRSLRQRGKLSDIPILLETYEKYYKNSDADIIPVWIADILGRNNPPYSEPIAFDSLQKYEDVVIQRYNQLVEEFKSEEVFLLRGKQFGVHMLSEYILERIQRPYFRTEIRHSFEASTGINCSNFYFKGKLQPLYIDSIVENFIENKQINHYEAGVRYFFGNRLVD
jgi:hypothetical protein